MRSRLLALILVGSLSVLAAQVTSSVSATGYITDTLCGAKGANVQSVWADCKPSGISAPRL
ncbi:MAG: hypothetical protein M1453_13800 [Acidobacteria bacterium]|nr:hypothetical protein [Acidobacteriota bacterium]MCL5289053.1 hypothetical protein [Acidobacteriota bacterium]